MTLPPRLSPLVLATLAACGSNDMGTGTEATATEAMTTGASTTAPTTSGATGSSGTTGEAPTTGVAEGLTYYRDIKPILDRKCATCHRPGDIGPFTITSYEETAKLSAAIGSSVADRSMPPWSPSAECNTYKHDRSLADAERSAILDWIAAGMPEGDPADEPTPDDDIQPEIDYDIALGIPEPFTPTAYPDDYRCFLLDWPKDQDSYATAFSVTPGERSIVHHVIAYVIPPAEVAAFEALDVADPGAGYPCYGGPGGEASQKAQWLGAWVPGGGGGAMPDGTGILVKPGSKIALQMHYHPLPGALPDLSTLKVRTAATVERPAYLLPLTNPGWLVDSPPMTIPAGAPDTEHSFEIDLTSAIYYLFPGSPFGIGTNVVAHAAGVHMHTLGTRASLTIERGAGGSDCLIDVPDWDFNWQGTYDLTASTVVKPSDKIRLECHFDNSSGDAALKWGEGTGDEMCLGMVYVSAP